jgi:MFS family permease
MKPDLYKNYLLGILLVAYALNWLDRMALGLVLQDIKVQYSLSDTQLGLLTGIAFSAFYAVAGIPLARWVDRGNRVTVISVTLALWSLMVCLSGLATCFAALLLIRACVAVGEAGCMPVANSIIPDYFTRVERPRATAIFLLGGSLSNVIGFWLGGWLNQLYGWRVMFVLLGLPGLGLAALARFTLREPRNREPALSTTGTCTRFAQRLAAVSPGPPSMSEVCLKLWTNRTFRHLLFNFAISAFFNYGIFQWQATFFVRSFDLHSGEVGAWFAGVYGVGGLVGTYLGGSLPARFARNNERLQLKAMAACYLGQAVLFSTIYLSHSPYWAFGMLGMIWIVGGATGGPVFALIQSLVPERMRAISIALLFLCTNLIGIGLGSLAVGALSDALQPWVGEESLRYALLAMCPGYCWAAWHLWRARQSVTADLAANQVDEQANMAGRGMPVVTPTPSVRYTPSL